MVAHSYNVLKFLRFFEHDLPPDATCVFTCCFPGPMIVDSNPATGKDLVYVISKQPLAPSYRVKGRDGTDYEVHFAKKSAPAKMQEFMQVAHVMFRKVREAVPAHTSHAHSPLLLIVAFVSHNR